VEFHLEPEPRPDTGPTAQSIKGYRQEDGSESSLGEEFRIQELQELKNGEKANFVTGKEMGIQESGVAEFSEYFVDWTRWRWRRLGGAWRHLRGGLPYPLWDRILGRQYEAMGFLPDYQVHECLRWFCHVIKMAR
jgi:hypothetical protein